MKKFLLFLLIGSLPLTFCGCPDWLLAGFLNSVPVKGDPEKNPEFHIYLAIDGLSYDTIQEAMARGALKDSEWKVAKFITMFPGTSDASWSRILHTEKLKGYEIEYYDPNHDEIKNKGIIGLSKHIFPTFHKKFSFEPKYLQAFDFRGTGYSYSFHAYQDTYASSAETLDHLFAFLGGRVETASAVTAYILEFDVLGHTKEKKDVTETFMRLLKKVSKFIKSQKKRKVFVTFLADHGMDFIPIKLENLVQFDKEMRKIGINPVEHLNGHDPTTELFAIPIMHTRVTYLAVHTHPTLVEEIGGRLSQLPSVDFALSKLINPAFVPLGAPPDLEWYGIWADGDLAIGFGFDPKRNEYHLPDQANYKRIGIENTSFLTPRQRWSIFKDSTLFHLTKHLEYPDLFFRARTSLAPVSVKYPADIMISFKPGYVSRGFKPPGGDDIAVSSFHGSLHRLGTVATLLTNEPIQLPDAVRSDQLFEFFPKMKEQIGTHKIHFVPGDANASIPMKEAF